MGTEKSIPYTLKQKRDCKNMNHFYETADLCDPKQVAIRKYQKHSSILAIKDNVSIEQVSNFSTFN